MTPSFYVTGGTLAVDTPSYVPRNADSQLLEALLSREFCYVLTSRQMGKSSLMVRTAVQLRRTKVRVAVIDLTAIGVNVTPDQWYEGLLLRLGRQLELEDEIEDFLEQHSELNPLQRWLFAVESILLDASEQPIVIFIDEIDLVRSLPFSADEFFAAIRQIYNRRSDESAWRRITFCLLGVATPSDLISDPHITPFNIGTRIELLDFRNEEANVLLAGLRKKPEIADRLLARILDWTSGHPYLTQRMCSLVAGDVSINNERDIDRLCETAFLSLGARDQDDNLIFVRERILRSESDLATVLDLYAKILRGRKITDDSSAIVETLKLSGIVRADDGYVRPRNRIYEAVFDAAWIRANMPDAELRRQRAAFYDGLIRATSIAAAIVLLLGGACGFAFYQWVSVGEALKLAKINEAVANREHARALEAAQATTEALGRETEQRLVAEQREREAARLRIEAQEKEQESIQLRLLSESRRRTAEADRRAAIESSRKLQIAYQQLVAEKRSVEERGKLFLAFPQWLQAYSAEAVAAHARSQIEAGKRADALKTYAEFCDLALSDDEGFWARELIRIDPEHLQRLDLDANVLATRIHVEPINVLKKVLEPGIVLGEQEQRKRAGRDSKSLLASLYDSQARLLFQQPELVSDNSERLRQLIRIYDRAIELDDSRSHFYVGRAVARFSQGGYDLDLVRADLESALAQYPTRVEPPSNESAITSAHRDLAMIHNGLANILEMQSDVNLAAAARLLADALTHHEVAVALNPAEVRYAISLARANRKVAINATMAKRQAAIATAIEILERAEQREAENARLHNELGETYLLQGDLEPARHEFDLAVRYGDIHDSKRNRYRYYCNQANAYWRVPTNIENLQQALIAAEKALELDLDAETDALYYRGLANWSLANALESDTAKSRHLTRAIADLEQVLEQNAAHVGAMLGRCQLLFELEDETLEEARLATLLSDTSRALELAPTPADRAKAHYVRGLGLVRRYVDTQQESPLIEALESFLAAGKSAAEYVSLVKAYFEQAAQRSWQDKELQSQASRLKTAIEALQASDR